MKAVIEYNKILSYVTYLNKVPVIRSILLQNDGEEALEQVEVQVFWEQPVGEQWRQTGIRLEPGQSLKLNLVVKLFGKEFVAMTEGYNTAFQVVVKSGEELLYQESCAVQILAYDQWLGSNYHPTLIASFVTPNHPLIAGVVRRAGEILKNWNLALTGYQTQDKNDVRAQMKAVYLALQAEGINYISAPPAFEQLGQRIRLADEVLTGKLGNCIELAVLFAACLEYIGLNPLIILFREHAFAGCWLEDQTFPGSVDDDIAALTKRLAKGIQRIELVETTLLTSPQPVSYEDAAVKAEEELLKEQEFEYLLDVAKARSLGVRPLPQRIELLSAAEALETAAVGQMGEAGILAAQPEALETGGDIEVITSRKRSKLKVWESKLLNLTLRNNLLNFRPTRRSISILEGDLNLLEDNLSSGQEFSLMPCPAEIEAERRKDKEYSYTRSLKDEYREYMNAEMKSRRLVTLLGEDDLDFAIKALYYTARTELEENGANTLFVAMGFLQWFETDLSKQARYAPILLYPIEMIRKSSAKGYVIRYRDEEVQVNTTLLEKLRMDLNLEFPGLVPLPMDEHGVDVKKILNTIRTGILNKKGWDVIDASYIALFSFNQFVMWNDIHSRSEELMENPIVGSLMQGKMNFVTPPLIDGKEIDQTDLFFNNAVLMDADSSQLVAVYSAAGGSSFVLHGPPGTGKSQTITNIIASALYNNKSVLFVAEKMAALNVVQSRLEKIGLGDFALELHSNKAKKGEVLAKLGRILDRQKNGEIKEIRQKRESLSKLRDAIAATTEALHRTGQNGYSIYEMIALYEAQGAGETYPIGELAAGLTKEQVQQIKQAIERYLPLFAEVEPVPVNPLRFIQNFALSFKEREELRTILMSLVPDLQQLTEQKGGLDDILADKNDFLTVSGFIALIADMTAAEVLLWPDILNWNQPEADDRTAETIAWGKRQRELRQVILAEFQPAVLQLDAAGLLLAWKRAGQKWFLGKWLEQNKIKKSLMLYRTSAEALNQAEIEGKLALLSEYAELTAKISSFMTSQAERFAGLWRAEETDWEQIEAAAAAARRITEALRRLYRGDRTLNLSAWLESLQKQGWLFYKEDKKPAASGLSALAAEIVEKQRRLEELAQGSFLAENFDLVGAKQEAEAALAAYTRLDQWLAYVQIRTEIERLGAGIFSQKTENGEIRPEELKAAALRSLMYYGVIEALEREKELTAFNHHNFEYLLAEYRQELKLVTEMTRLELIEKLTANIPQPFGDINAGSELGVLKKAIKNSGRGLSLRRLFDMTPNVLRRLAPCMLMSPISIAQYIDPSFPKFDLVIFDEASQVNTHEAVGAIARGSQLIVVGDPNQLPPTSFFKGNFDEEDIEFEEADQDSVLDECQAILFPELHLKWHYRSKHESLIAFSNSQYYENKLYTFPSYNDLESKVSLVQVEGFYDRSGTKQNEAEAEAVIAEIRRRLLDERLRRQSLGVVTFSSVQQKLIQVKLDELFAAHPELEEYAGASGEEIFVKNLENVQGDERDVILFSVGYGPDQKGKVTMNFGPLNQSEGWKRLNVVVSRSREEMIVYAVLKPEQIDLSRTDSLGVAGLKRFLEFARNKNTLTVDAQTVRLKKDELIDTIAAELENAGFSVVKQVGHSNYRIDIGVVDKDRPQEFMAAIVLDGYQYYETPTVRDRTIVQPTMLGRLKWKVIPVWTLDWFKNKAAVLEMILGRLAEIAAEREQEKAAAAEARSIVSAAPVKADAAAFSKESFAIEYEPAPAKEQIYYEAYPLAPEQYPKEAFYTGAATGLMVRLMSDIIEWEAPIVEDDLFRRILSVWGISQLGAKLTEVLKQAAAQTGAFYLLDDEQNTYWRSREQYEAGISPRRCRTDRRKFPYICDDEIAATILEILSEQISLDFKNLCREVFKFHGYNMLGEEAQNRVYGCLGVLIGENKVIEEDGRYIKATEPLQ